MPLCKHRSIGLEENLEHMLKTHSLYIPDKDALIFYYKTLIEYFHLVIFGYFECLYCGSQRSDDRFRLLPTKSAST